MLQKIRSNVQGLAAKLIIGLICLTFALWGVDALFIDSGDPDVAEVNGTTISERELNQQIYRQRQQIMARMGENIDPAQIDENLLRGPVLNGLIEQRLLETAAEDQDFYVSERMIERRITQDPNFQIDGRWSPDRFNSLIRANGLTPLGYKESMRNQLLIFQLLSGFQATEFVTPAEYRQAVSITGQKRDVEYAVLEPDASVEATPLDDGEVQAYYDEHPDEFMTEDQVVVKYIELDVADFYPELDEAAIRKVYDEEVAQMEAGIRRRAAHILLEVGDQRTAQQARDALLEIRQRLAQGEDFADLARELSEDRGSRDAGGDLGYTDGDAFPEAFEQALAGLSMGQVSEPVETEAGWHLVRLTEQETAEPPSFEARRAAIVRSLQMQEAEPRYAVALESLRDVSFNAPDLASVAKELQLEVEDSEAFSRSGAAAGLFADQRLVAEAFTRAVLVEGANSDVVELSPTQAVVLRVTRHDKPEAIPFADVSTDIARRLREEKAAAQVRERAVQWQEAVAGGESLAARAEAAEASYSSYSSLTREDIQGADPAIIEKAFQMVPPGSQPTVAVQELAGGAAAVVVVTRVEPGSPEDIDDSKRDNLKQLLGRYRAEQAVQSYRAELRDQADIEML